MKKTYINPNIEVIKIQTQQMLAASNQGLSNAEATVNGTNDYSNALGRDDEYDW